MAGVTLLLVDGTTGEPMMGDAALPGYYGGGRITTVTDANGHYQFLGLRAGTYGVVEIQPTGLDLIDNVDRPGSLGGYAGNPDGVPVGRRVDPTGIPVLDQQRDDVRKLLKDESPTVRFQVGLALAQARDKEAVSTLIGLLDEPALKQAERGRIEMLLYRLAADRSPATPALSAA